MQTPNGSRVIRVQLGAGAEHAEKRSTGLSTGPNVGQAPHGQHRVHSFLPLSTTLSDAVDELQAALPEKKRATDAGLE